MYVVTIVTLMDSDSRNNNGNNSNNNDNDSNTSRKRQDSKSNTGDYHGMVLLLDLATLATFNSTGLNNEDWEVTSIPRKKLRVCHYLDDDMTLDVAKSSGNTKEVTSLLIISNVSWEVGKTQPFSVVTCGIFK